MASGKGKNQWGKVRSIISKSDHRFCLQSYPSCWSPKKRSPGLSANRSNEKDWKFFQVNEEEISLKQPTASSGKKGGLMDIMRYPTWEHLCRQSHLKIFQAADQDPGHVLQLVLLLLHALRHRTELAGPHWYRDHWYCMYIDFVFHRNSFHQLPYCRNPWCPWQALGSGCLCKFDLEAKILLSFYFKDLDGSALPLHWPQLLRWTLLPHQLLPSQVIFSALWLILPGDFLLWVIFSCSPP